MRRSLSDIDQMARLRPVALAVNKLPAHEVELRITALEGFVTPERREKLLRNIERRVRSVNVILDSFHDPHNGAAIVRTADVFGLQYVHVLERYESFLAARSVARGSERWVDVTAHRSVDDIAKALPPDKIEWIAAHPDGELEPGDLTVLKEPFAIVVGSEREGIGQDLASRCRRAVRVPMRGYAESLNVSVTTGILLYEATKGRAGDLLEHERRQLYLRGLVQSLQRAHDLLAAAELPLALTLDP
jgi:tRNA (guanosine-2'-O-)-methyltransferase